MKTMIDLGACVRIGWIERIVLAVFRNEIGANCMAVADGFIVVDQHRDGVLRIDGQKFWL